MGIDINRLGPAAQKQVLAHLQGQKKAPKYHNEKVQRVMPNGKTRTFDSIREARRYDELALLLAAGKIRDLRLQRNFTLQEGFISAEGEAIKPIVYKADFTYERPTAPDCTGTVHWLLVVEDAKGVKTKDYLLKKKMLLDRFGLVIKEV